VCGRVNPFPFPKPPVASANSSHHEEEEAKVRRSVERKKERERERGRGLKTGGCVCFVWGSRDRKWPCSLGRRQELLKALPGLLLRRLVD